MSRASARTRVIVVLAIALAAGAALGGVVARTTANWTDEVNFEAQATAGTWAAQPWTCYPATPQPGATCDLVLTAGTSVWQDGFNLNFDVVSASSPSFRWEVRFDLSVNDHSTAFGTFFVGYPLPWGSNRFSGSNMCVVSAGELPFVRVRGLGTGKEMVGQGSPVTGEHLQSQRFFGFPLGAPPPGIPLCAN